jgi:hypothetical protein
VGGVALYQCTGRATERVLRIQRRQRDLGGGCPRAAANAAPPARYEIECDDLHRFGSTDFDELVTGATINLTDAALTINASPLRITAKPLIDYLFPKKTRLALANRAQLLAEYLSQGPAGTATAPVTPIKPVTPPPIVPVPPVTTPGAGGVQSVPLPILDGGDVVLLAQPEAATDYGWAQPWFDSSGYSEGRVIVHVDDAGATDAEAYLEQSSNGGETFAEPGVSAAPIAVSIAEVGPFASAWIALGTESIGDRVWRGMLRGGDGVASPAIAKFHAQFRGASAPVPPRGGGAPPDLPEGAWGNIVFDANAAGATMAEMYGDGDDVNVFIDDITSNSLVTGATLLLPKYRATGFAGGRPCVEWAGANVPLATAANNPTEPYGTYTYYFALDGMGGGADGARIWGRAGDSFDYALYCYNSSFGAANNNLFGGQTFASDTWDMSAPHLYRWVKDSASSRWQLFVDGTMVLNVANAPQTNNGGVITLMDYLSGLGLDGKVGRVVAYDKAHSAPTPDGALADGLTGPEIVLKAAWGTP